MTSSVFGIAARCISSLALACALTAAPAFARQSDHQPLRIAAVEGAALGDWDRTIAGMERDRTLRPRQSRDDTLLSGRTHERLDQYYKGVRVLGGDIARQTDGASTVSIFGSIYPDVVVDVNPTLTVDEALEAASQAGASELLTQDDPELVIVPSDGYLLAYRVRVRMGRDIQTWLIDARTGGVLKRSSEIRTQQGVVGTGSGVLGDDKKISVNPVAATFTADDRLRPPSLITYDMRGSLARTELLLSGFLQPSVNDIASDPDNRWSDGAAVDAHAYAGYTYDYYFKRFGRRGLDNNNTPILSIVHPVRRQDYFTASDDAVDNFYLNAFWCGGCGPRGTGMMSYGEGLPPNIVLIGPGNVRLTVDFFSGALDVVAHELTHGVTEFTSNLNYESESGALNEAFSDIMGTSVEFFYQTAGSGTLRADWLIGEDIIRPGGIRSMSDPASFGDPDHYSRRYTGPEDNGGVHINSGIVNQAFYLAIEGGANRTSGLSVQGVGAGSRDQIERAFYRAFTSFLTSRSNFAAARAATIQAANELYGVSSAASRAITQAWSAVGVF